MTRHSFFFATLAIFAGCVASCSRANDEADVNASVQHLVSAVNAKDLNGIMAYYSPDESLFVFDALPPRQYVGASAYRKNWEGFLAAYAVAVHAEVSDWKTETEGRTGTVFSRPGKTRMECLWTSPFASPMFIGR
jgi:ketosteroid isomerase-like protein